MSLGHRTGGCRIERDRLRRLAESTVLLKPAEAIPRSVVIAIVVTLLMLGARRWRRR